ncbi:DUF4238 domain-containing protein [Mycobacteroides chelonae]|nr:DUF4238 domain-containing protein [Mycobacteroides chelonae]MEC4873522.1 DUF4238 domain-containing protein [Mycobacteroides chelonae]
MLHRWTADVAIAESKRQAGQARVGKRHHHVPQMYLRRWAGADGRVRLTNLASGNSYLQPPKEVARRDNLYRISADDLPAEFPGLWFEKHMSRIESEATAWFKALDDVPDGRLRDQELIADMAVFVALQDQRTLRQHQQELRIEDALNRFGRREVLGPMLPDVCRLYGIPYSLRFHDQILQRFLDQPLVSRERKPRALESAIGVWRNRAVPYFTSQRTWWLISSASSLLTCDEPIVYLGGSVRRRWETASWATSPIVLFPIGPHRLLVLTDNANELGEPYQLSRTEAGQVNFEVVAASNQFCYEHPAVNVAASIDVPRRSDYDPALATTFAEAVLEPSRWNEGEGPEWAVPRWYSGTG